MSTLAAELTMIDWLMRRNVWSSLRRISSGGGVAHLAKAIGNTLHTVGPMSRSIGVITVAIAALRRCWKPWDTSPR
jgi:hypothetical protein